MELSQDERLITIRAINNYAGSFAQALALALQRADLTNTRALLQAFGPQGTGTLCPYLPGGWAHTKEARRYWAEPELS